MLNYSYLVPVKYRILALCFFITLLTQAQKVSFHVVDAKTNEPIPGVSIGIKKAGIGGMTDESGNFSIDTTGRKGALISIDMTGYKPVERTVNTDLHSPQQLKLENSEVEINEVIISTTRTNSRIEQQAQKIEVLGMDEMTEESTIAPDNIASLLGDLAGLQVQQTSAMTGNSTIRIQGMDGKYTQYRRDGFPVPEGISSGLGLLDIPPVDLKQVEIIKGPSSTFFGGGAVAGLINFISRDPEDSLHLTAILNRTSLRETNLSVFTSGKNNKNGFTLMLSGTMEPAYDANGDGYSDAPYERIVNWHPQWFHYLSGGAYVRVGYTGMYSKTNAGEMKTTEKYQLSETGYHENNTLQKDQIDFIFSGKKKSKFMFNAKAMISSGRRILYSTNTDYTSNEQTGYAEFSWLKSGIKNNIAFGATVNYNRLKFDLINFANSSSIYQQAIPGLFFQDTYTINQKFLLQGGARTDYVRKRFLLLPSLSFAQKWTPSLSSRISGGFGYRLPSEFNTENFSSLDDRTAISLFDPERSIGINADATYQHALGNFFCTLNQSVFYNNIKHGLQEFPFANQVIVYTLNQVIHTKGTESYIRLRYHEAELYVGYTFTLNELGNYLQFYSPKNRFATTLINEFGESWKAGIEASYTSRQKRYDETFTSGWWLAALMLQHRFGKMSLTANCENLFNFKQSNYETLVDNSNTIPQFRFIWGPTTGRIINIALKINI